jgi:hypothetical protein
MSYLYLLSGIDTSSATDKAQNYPFVKSVPVKYIYLQSILQRKEKAMGNNVPCYGCEKRSASCHSSCKEYKDFRQVNIERSELICRKRNEESMITETRIKSVYKTAGKRRPQKAWKGT